jgi:hypothetical protein
MEPSIFTIPERSVLMRPVPKGLGTGQVQALPSYLCDVGALHGLSLGQMVAHFLPAIRRSKAGKLKRTHRWVTREALLVEIFGALTKRDDLHFLTHLPWEATISCNARSQHIKWCPHCLRNDPYGRLLWTYQAVNACPIHKTMLESACHGCGTVTNRNVKRPAWLFCGCGSKHRNDPRSRAADADEVWHATQISELLAKAFEKPDIKINRLREVVQTKFLPLFGDVDSMVRHCGIPLISIYGYKGTFYRMTIPNLLAAARSTGLSLVDLLTAPIDQLHPRIGPATTTTVAPQQKISKEALRSMVAKALSMMPPEIRTLGRVAKEVGVSADRIANNLPDIVKELAGSRNRRAMMGKARNDAIIVERMVAILEDNPSITDLTLAHLCGLRFFWNTQKLIAKARQIVAESSLPAAA